MKRIVGLLLLFVFASSDAALVSRLGGEAYYDDLLDITWTADANINGAGTWDAQTAWAASLDINGVTGWRLPSVDVDGINGIVDCETSSQADCTDNEFDHLFWYGANTIRDDGDEIRNPSPTSPFDNVGGVYFSSTLAGTLVYIYDLSLGNPTFSAKSTPSLAWAVKDGDVGVVPVPAAAWLFGSALGLLGWVRRASS